MTQNSTFNVKLFNSQLNNLKPGMKNGSQIILNLQTNVVGECNDEINDPHKLLLTDKQVLRTGKAFTNGSPVNMKFSKTQLMV